MVDELNSLFSQYDCDINLVEATLLIAKDEYPQLDINAYLGQIDYFAEQIRSRLPSGYSAEEAILKLNDYLFDELGFTGDMDDYYNPRNSLLNDVIDRKKGIPITLSIIYLEIGRRLGLDLEGISFPGHFLVRFNVGTGAVVLDPFFGGVSLSEQELETRLTQVEEDHQITPLHDLLTPASNKSILVRVLKNLRNIYIQDEAIEKALKISNRILTISPNNAEEHLLRGTLYQNLECFKSALSDYEKYFELDPYNEKNEHLRDEIVELRNSMGYLH